jgi:hypothetical protein
VSSMKMQAAEKGMVARSRIIHTSTSFVLRPKRFGHVRRPSRQGHTCLVLPDGFHLGPDHPGFAVRLHVGLEELGWTVRREDEVRSVRIRKKKTISRASNRSHSLLLGEFNADKMKLRNDLECSRPSMILDITQITGRVTSTLPLPSMDQAPVANC